jgi:hypothetical protein
MTLPENLGRGIFTYPENLGKWYYGVPRKPEHVVLARIQKTWRSDIIR